MAKITEGEPEETGTGQKGEPAERSVEGRQTDERGGVESVQRTQAALSLALLLTLLAIYFLFGPLFSRLREEYAALLESLPHLGF